MLSNNALCLHVAAQYVLLFLVQLINFQIYGVTHSYSSLPVLVHSDNMWPKIVHSSSVVKGLITLVVNASGCVLIGGMTSD